MIAPEKTHQDKFPTRTACECTSGGWCQRHACYKQEGWYELCRQRPEYFERWEQGRGLCLPGPELGPGIGHRIWNFLLAIKRHLQNWARKVPRKVYRERISHCKSCSSLDVGRMVCREKQCGCFITLKAKWASEACPLGKWERDERSQQREAQTQIT